ncbi:hypothetical protein C2G38_2123739 [Gigaspora rosea]|uniref:Uncharacterized protein n=1 Tax=Gigaspora rosea TaxID=44941 RepID=A0A397U280_9GLOM|nr:hypothetical protein C2G38_2123739 [Gigaspora rosea]
MAYELGLPHYLYIALCAIGIIILIYVALKVSRTICCTICWCCGFLVLVIAGVIIFIVFRNKVEESSQAKLADYGAMNN